MIIKNRVTNRTLLGLGVEILHANENEFIEVQPTTLACMIDEIERWRALNMNRGIFHKNNNYECPRCQHLDRLTGQGKMTMKCSECGEIYAI